MFRVIALSIVLLQHAPPREPSGWPTVAEAWKKYDISLILRTQWRQFRPRLAGKIHVYCGDMDNFYLNLAVYRLESFLRGVTNPAFGGTFEYGRPMKGHGWTPLNQAELVSTMAGFITQHSPAGADKSWKY